MLLRDRQSLRDAPANDDPGTPRRARGRVDPVRHLPQHHAHPPRRRGAALPRAAGGRRRPARRLRGRCERGHADGEARELSEERHTSKESQKTQARGRRTRAERRRDDDDDPVPGIRSEGAAGGDRPAPPAGRTRTGPAARAARREEEEADDSEKGGGLPGAAPRCQASTAYLGGKVGRPSLARTACSFCLVILT